MLVEELLQALEPAATVAGWETQFGQGRAVVLRRFEAQHGGALVGQQWCGQQRGQRLGIGQRAILPLKEGQDVTERAGRSDRFDALLSRAVIEALFEIAGQLAHLASFYA